MLPGAAKHLQECFPQILKQCTDPQTPNTTALYVAMRGSADIAAIQNVYCPLQTAQCRISNNVLDPCHFNLGAQTPLACNFVETLAVIQFTTCSY